MFAFVRVQYFAKNPCSCSTFFKKGVFVFLRVQYFNEKYAFVFDNLGFFRVRSCSIIFEKSAFVFVHVRGKFLHYKKFLHFLISYKISIRNIPRCHKIAILFSRIANVLKIELSGSL